MPRFALLALLILGGANIAHAAPRAARAPADTGVVVEITARRTAELADSRGSLRVFDEDVRIEYKAGGSGPGLDAGTVTLDGHALRADTRKKGGVSYRAGRGDAEQAGGNPWVTLANAGAVVPADTVRIKLAPYPAVTRPAPGQAVRRDEDLMFVMLPPVADVWYRVSLVGSSTVTALDMGEGRWVFPSGSLLALEPGSAHLLIEVETSCGSCPVSPKLRAVWSSRTELELPITIL